MFFNIRFLNMVFSERNGEFILVDIIFLFCFQAENHKKHYI